ncbi:hypothetical protein BDZ97DRAFT_1912126 [Flammula alnicola]|nr:hypothetical protein BDZ97DRAFT_1912126 [Flammula alnicola]
MTSRVQKGGTVFRPVAKSRARTAPSASRQPSVLLEQLGGEYVNTASLDLNSSFPSLPSSLPAAPTLQDQHGSTTEQQSSSMLSDAAPGNDAAENTLNTVFETQFIPPRVSAMPPVVVSSTINIVRSSPAVPTIMVTRSSQTPLLELFTPSLPQIFNDDESAECQLSSTLIQATISTNENSGGSSSLAEPTRHPTTLTNSNSISSLPGEQEHHEVPSVKGGTRKRKIKDDSTKRLKRRRGGSKDVEDVEHSQDGLSSRQSRASSRASSSTPRPRKRAPSPPPYDPDADPGEDIDPTTVTMAALCSDTGQGRVSRKAAEILSNHAAWKIKNREKRARMKSIMEAKKYGREEDDLENNQEVDDTGNDFDYSQGLTTSRYNVQVRIGPNGETVIDEESLVVDRVENDGTENYTHVIESDHTKFVNSGTYGKRYRGSRWSAEETELFYDALAQYGENYELIAYVLPGRDRKSCKNKFKVEDKRNHARINHCLNNSIPVDMKTLSRMTGKDFSGPVPEIRAPPPMPTVTPNEESSEMPTEDPPQRVKKRSRSKSHGVAESGVVVLGDAENFES